MKTDTLVVIGAWYLILLAILWAGASRFGLSEVLNFDGPGAYKKLLYVALYFVPVPFLIAAARRKKSH